MVLVGCKKNEKENPTSEIKNFITASTIHGVKTKIDELLKTHKPEDILVAFDIDMTLTQPDHPATYYPALKKYKLVYKDILKDLSPIQRDAVVTYTSELPQRLIEKDSPKVIKSLQDSGVKVIAFTARLSGHRDDHKNKTIFKTRDRLQTMGFHFNVRGVSSYFDFPMYAGGYPMIYHGVLSSNGENTSKGKVLNNFLYNHDVVANAKRSPFSFRPKVIVMVDDKKSNLEDIQKALAEKNPDIKFVGFEFTGTFDYAPKDISQNDFESFWKNFAERSKKDYPKP